ncbi:Sulphatase-modifying factor domain protein, partial [mine drainage metagenome]
MDVSSIAAETPAAQGKGALRAVRLDGRDPGALRADILRAFHATFDRHESLFDLLRNDAAWRVKPIALRHPLIFYFGHTAAFFINKLVVAELIGQRIAPRLESLFAVGVDEMSWDDLDDIHYDWPTPQAVRAYRDRVREVVDGLIRGLPLDAPIAWDSPWWVILMGIEHERIHLETSSVLMRQHKLEYLKPHPAWQPCRDSGVPPRNALVDVRASHVRLGRDRDQPHVYGWDNEFGAHEADVAAFQAARYLVSNHEFRAFVEAGGYADDSLWSEEGAAWRCYTRAAHPTFWVRDGGAWRLRL